MKQVYYYLRYPKNVYKDGGRHPYGCVCLLKNDNGDVARGISVCSERDDFSKKIGRNKAYGYAVKALTSKKSIRKHSAFACWIAETVESRDTRDVMFPTYPQSAILLIGNKEVANSDTVLSEFEKSLLAD